MPVKHRVCKRIHVCMLLLCIASFAFGRGPIALASAYAPAVSFDHLSRPVAASSANRVDITTTADLQDGNTSSLTSLVSAPGLDGKISLREAIQAANTSTITEPLTIGFALPISDTNFYSGTWTITLNAPLPELTHGQVTIDGTSQFPAATRPPIALDGHNAIYDGIVIASADNLVRGLTLMNFYGNGIVLHGSAAARNQIAGCYIGTDPTGEQARPNGTGILISDGAYGNLIGGANLAARNLISGSDYEAGVLIQDGSTHDNLVVGNWIGVDSSGGVLLSNEGGGVIVRDGAYHNLIGGLGWGNVIADTLYGVSISGSVDNTLTHNIIGLAADGQTQLRDAKGAVFRPMVGVFLDSSAHHNQIGLGGEGNIISGNGTGVIIVGGANNVLAGNIIGLTANGGTTIGNIDGLYIGEGARDNIVGGKDPNERNVISGNSSDGIRILQPGSDNNRIEGNYIGVDRDGTRAGFGNGGYGVRIDYAASKNWIGGTSAEMGNVIAYNGAGGIRLDAPGNHVAHNRIGLGADGTQLGNQNNGVRIGAGGDDNVIGPDNQIAYNQFSGIIISGRNTTVMSNTLEANIRSAICVTGMSTRISDNTITHNGLGNGPWVECPIRGGIVITGTDSTIISSNAVYDNIGFGITIHGGQGNQILNNSISRNSGGGIKLEEGGNGGIAPPVIESVTLIESDSATEVTGTSCPFCLVEIFADEEDEGRDRIGYTTAKADSSFTYTSTLVIPATYITATHTDSNGNTSSFANAVSVPLPTPPPEQIVYYGYLPFILRLR